MFKSSTPAKTAHMCVLITVYNCGTQKVLLLIFPLILQTITTAQIMSVGGEKAEIKVITTNRVSSGRSAATWITVGMNSGRSGITCSFTLEHNSAMYSNALAVSGGHRDRWVLDLRTDTMTSITCHTCINSQPQSHDTHSCLGGAFHPSGIGKSSTGLYGWG